ncbi:hypothetical protein QZH41_000507 [Actinostola sp. cb2023]|nr:hypothetical protein QZH41_000507 [Actinostola sp. cb2023]
MRLQTLVLESQNQLAFLTKQYEELYERYGMLAHLEKWGDIIREKDEEIKRQQEHIRKMIRDRAEALNEKNTAEAALDGLRSKLRRKNREIQEIKAAEKIYNKAVVLSETQSLRNERDMALAKLAQREVIIEKLKLNVRQSQEELLHKAMVLQDTDVLNS